MKVLYVRNGIFGKDHYIISEIEITKALRELNIDARLIVKGEKETGDPFIIPLKVPFNKNRYFVLKLFFYLPFYVLKNKIDFVVLDEKSVIPSLLLIFFNRLLKTKLILDVRTVPVEQKKLSKQQMTAYKIARKFFDGATFITETTREMCEKEYGLKFNKNAVYTSGVNEKVFTKDVEININGKIAEKLKDHFVMIYHGSITPNRGVEMVLDAVDSLKEEIPNLLFLSISDNNRFLQKYCADNNLRLDDHLLFLDAADNAVMPQYIKLADIGVIPYKRIKWWEVSSPLKLMEYLSMEIPIVMSDIQAHLNVVPRESDFSVYFNPDQKNELTEKILYAYKNIKKLNSKTYIGRKIVLEKLTWHNQAEKMAGFLESIYINQKPLFIRTDKKFSEAKTVS